MDSIYLEEEKTTTFLEQEIRRVSDEIERTIAGVFDENDDELTNLSTENAKLKHRLAILNRAIAVERKDSKTTPTEPITEMISINDHLVDVFTSAINEAYPNLVQQSITAVITVGTNPKFGDYQCNSAMQISKALQQQNIKQSPRDIAGKILENISTESALIEKCDVAGAGFINIYLSRSYGRMAVSTIIRDNCVRPPKIQHLEKLQQTSKDKKPKVVIDFSSPNIAKEMHVGHLRSTIIGESISRLLEYLNFDVLRINHVGDWGTQFGMLIAHLEDRFPNYANVSPPISDLQTFYKESKALFDSDPEFKKRAYDRVVKLQNGDPKCTNAWNLICDVSRKDFQKIYDRLDIKLIERGESFYQSRMINVIDELNKQNLLEVEDGRTIMWGEPVGEGIPLTIIKSDGGFTYDTSDMATIKQRLHEENGDWLIYVTDAGQATHFKVIYACAERAGILDRSKIRIDHVGFGVVLGEDGKKFKTRSGDTVKLTELLEEGLNRAKEKLIEKGRDQVLTSSELTAAQESVAYGCIKYADLSNNRNNEYIFSFDRMLQDKGNTAIYLLYAYTRIKSIARNCGGDFVNNIQKLLETTEISVEHEKEWKLTKVLLKFPDIIARITKDLCLHHLCEYVYEVSTTFTEFYNSCYCIEKNEAGDVVKINGGRILLAEATALVMAQCFEILGLKPVEKM